MNRSPAPRPAVHSGVHRLLAILTLLTPLLPSTTAAAAPAAPSAYTDGARVFVDDMVRRHGLDRAEITDLVAAASHRRSIIDAMDRPYEAKPWRDYRSLFLTPERIEGGSAFLQANARLLQRAEGAYGVPPEIITAIIGIETNYGRNLGKHRVLDALTTLGFAYPRRSAFFRDELESFVLLCRDEGIDPLAAVGSYAGAMGMPQFIPSSYRAYAVDFDADGRRDLYTSTADAVGSVANYLARHGWQPGEPVAARTEPAGAAAESLNGDTAIGARLGTGFTLAGKRPQQPDTTVGTLAGLGLAAEPLPIDAPAALIRLAGEEPEYWIALTNFYVITRYNHSNLYAMAVHQLGRAIGARQQPAGAR